MAEAGGFEMDIILPDRSVTFSRFHRNRRQSRRPGTRGARGYIVVPANTLNFVTCRVVGPTYSRI